MNYSVRVALYITDPREGQERQLGLPPFTLEADSVDAARQRLAKALEAVTLTVAQPEELPPARRRSVPVPREQPLNPNEQGYESPHAIGPNSRAELEQLERAKTEHPEPENESTEQLEAPHHDWERR